VPILYALAFIGAITRAWEALMRSMAHDRETLRRIGRIYQLWEQGTHPDLLPSIGAAAWLADTIRSETQPTARADDPPDGVIATGGLAGCYVPPQMSRAMLIGVPSMVTEDR
jgi:hypothetical protein